MATTSLTEEWSDRAILKPVQKASRKISVLSPLCPVMHADCPYKLESEQLKAERDALRQKLQDANAQLAGLSKLLAKARADLAAEKADRAAENAAREAGSKNSDIDAVDALREKQLELEEKLAIEKAKAKAREAALLKQINDMKKKHTLELEALREKMLADMEALREKMEAMRKHMQAEIDALKERLAASERENRQLRKDLQVALHETRMLQGQLDEANNALNEAKKALSEALTSLAGMQAEMDSMRQAFEAQLAKMEAQIGELSGQLSALQQELNDAREQISSLEALNAELSGADTSGESKSRWRREIDGGRAFNELYIELKSLYLDQGHCKLLHRAVHLAEMVKREGF